MKHLHGNRILGRVATDRLHLLRNLSVSLLAHGSLVTTEAKAKELRKFFEPLVTKAKKETTLHRRRQLLADLPKASVPTLLKIAAAAKNRPGGYIRLTHLPSTRHDASPIMRVEIIDYV